MGQAILGSSGKGGTNKGEVETIIKEVGSNAYLNVYKKEKSKARNESFAINVWIGELGAETPEHVKEGDLVVIGLE